MNTDNLDKKEIDRGSKTGLVLEGGAMRGMFTAGVLDVLMEHEIVFDGAIGVSAGAAFGCNYKSGQIGRAIRYNTTYCKDPRYCSFRSLIKTGDMFGSEFCYHELPEKLDIFDMETYINSPMEFYVVCTDVVTGKPVYHNCSDMNRDELEWIRASASMPLASRIVEVGGYQLLDGGVSDSIPLKYFESIGYKKNLVVLTQPQDYIKKKNSMLPIMRMALKKYPELIKSMGNRHNVYNESVKYVADEVAAGQAYVIQPDEALPIGRVEHNAEKLKVVYELGRKSGEKHLGAVKKFIR